MDYHSIKPATLSFDGDAYGKCHSKRRLDFVHREARVLTMSSDWRWIKTEAEASVFGACLTTIPYSPASPIDA